MIALWLSAAAAASVLFPVETHYRLPGPSGYQCQFSGDESRLVAHGEADGDDSTSRTYRSCASQRADCGIIAFAEADKWPETVDLPGWRLDNLGTTAALYALVEPIGLLASPDVPAGTSQPTRAGCDRRYVEAFGSFFPVPGNLSELGRGTLSDGFFLRLSDAPHSELFEKPEAHVHVSVYHFTTPRKVPENRRPDLVEILAHREDGDIQSWTVRTLPNDDPHFRSNGRVYDFAARSPNWQVVISSGSPTLGRELFKEFLEIKAAGPYALAWRSHCVHKPGIR